jgi:hypothetical protein
VIVVVTLYFRRFKIRNPLKPSHPGWQQSLLAKEKADKEAAEKAAKKAEKDRVRTSFSLHLMLLSTLTTCSEQRPPLKVDSTSGTEQLALQMTLVIKQLPGQRAKRPQMGMPRARRSSIQKP